MPTLTEIRNQIVTDLAVIQKLSEGGDDERALHDIDHQMLADTEAKLKAVCQIAPHLIFEMSPITAVNGRNGPAFTCYFRTKSTTALGFMTRQSILMAALAEAFGCTYNGWGTQIVKLTKPG